MSAFHYIALNQEGKELKGIIDAPNEEAAREKLKDLKLSLVSLNEVAAQAPAEGQTKLNFEAVDSKGKKIIGTIAAEDAVKAYARLVTEYQLKVSTIDGKPSGELEKEYAKLASAKKKIPAEEEATKRQEQERQELLVKVDSTVKRIDSFLKQFGEELKNEERQILQGYLNQLVRIKDSTNLEHIKNTCERMLEHIQQQELFMNEDNRLSESSKIKVETQEMLASLKQTGFSKDIDIVKSAHAWMDNPVLRPLAFVLLRLFKAEDPELQALRDEIKILNRKMASYFKMLIFGKSKTVKAEAWESIKALRLEKRKLAMKIKQIRAELMKRGSEASGEALPEAGFFENAGTALGWILAFYLAAYIVSYPMTIKQFPLPPLPSHLYFYKTTAVKTLTLFFFIAYIAFTLRNFWLKKAWIGAFLVIPLCLFGFLLILINLI